MHCRDLAEQEERNLYKMGNYVSQCPIPKAAVTFYIAVQRRGSKQR